MGITLKILANIKSIISIKRITTTVPHSIKFNNRTITDPTVMSKFFNNYFTSTAKKTLISNFHRNIIQTNTKTTPTYKNGISFITSSFDLHKLSGPNNILVKILKLLKNVISQQVSDIFHMSFSTGQFPSLLKIAKVIPMHKNTIKS